MTFWVNERSTGETGSRLRFDDVLRDSQLSGGQLSALVRTHMAAQLTECYNQYTVSECDPTATPPPPPTTTTNRRKKKLRQKDTTRKTGPGGWVGGTSSIHPVIGSERMPESGGERWGSS